MILKEEKKIGVLFVCMGNICRSPTAEGVFRALVREKGLEKHIEIDSAGTHAYHIGNPPDSRSMQMAQSKGVDLSTIRARKVVEDDFDNFDYVLAMDQQNIENLYLWCHPDKRERLSLFLSFAPDCGVKEVPDPYFGGATGFEVVYDLVLQAAEGLLTDIRRQYALPS